jgi:cell division septation protein DedD
VAVAPAPAADATGGFAVQLGVSNSEGDAQAAFDRFQKKFSELEGRPSLIRKAEVNGNTVYRVRVGPMSRDDASSLCSKLQGQGGQCFVAKN